MNLNEAPQRIRWGTFVVLGGLALLLLVLDSSGNLDNALLFLENPMAAVLNWTGARVDSFAAALSGPADIQEANFQIQQLQLENDALRQEIEQLRLEQAQFGPLQELVGRVYETPNYTRVTGLVTGYDTSPVYRSLIIDVGSEDGVHVGMPVEGARGLVGQVHQTTAHSAEVLLVTDSSSSVPGRLGSSRAVGMVHGGGTGGVMTLDWVDLDAQIGIGDLVITSGLGGRFPENMVIGRVINVERREADLFQQAIIQPAVAFDSLEVVFVITDFEPVEPEIFSEPTPTP
jgi:rod shape-determining protein MreC